MTGPAYLPELLCPEGSYPLTYEEADLLHRALDLMRGRSLPPRRRVRLLTPAGDRIVAGLVGDGMAPESVAEALGVSVGAIRGAVRRVECGRYG